jgi:Asp-tRNA(Asn)/Glu-tRNA(Gln) amidotransferase A subunit family amidase
MNFTQILIKRIMNFMNSNVPSYVSFYFLNSCELDFQTNRLHSDAPICVQVTGRTFEDEAVIAMGKFIDDALKSWKRG